MEHVYPRLLSNRQTNCGCLTTNKSQRAGLNADAAVSPMTVFMDRGRAAAPMTKSSRLRAAANSTSADPGVSVRNSMERLPVASLATKCSTTSRARAYSLLMAVWSGRSSGRWAGACRSSARDYCGHRKQRAVQCRRAGLRFAAGSMVPKIDAAVAFARLPGRKACVGTLEEDAEVIAGNAWHLDRFRPRRDQLRMSCLFKQSLK